MTFPHFPSPPVSLRYTFAVAPGTLDRSDTGSPPFAAVDGAPPFEPVPARTVAEAAALAAEIGFLPVPVRARADGWTVARQVLFLRWLADLGSVEEAAAMVGMSLAGAYRLRKRAGAASFAFAWDAALMWAGETLMERSIRRAVEGTAVPVIIRHGRVTRAARVYDDQLLMKLMSRTDERKRRRHRKANF